MIPEELAKLDQILELISTDRYSIERVADIEPLITRLREIHTRYCEDLDRLSAEYLTLPHPRSLIEEILLLKKAEWRYMRAKAQEFSNELENDDLSTMAQEVLHFMSALQVYLMTASGKFINYYGHQEDILPFVTETSFSPKEAYIGESGSISQPYQQRTETGNLIQDDLGYKMYLLKQQVRQNWVDVSSACEKLKFITK